MKILLKIIKSLDLPIFVHSSVAILYGIIKANFDFSSEEIILLSLFCACKIEDIHGYLNKIIENASNILTKERNVNINITKLITHENKIMDYLNFDFDLPNIYRNAFGMIVMANELNIPTANLEECAKTIELCLSQNEVLAKIGDIYKKNPEMMKKFCNEIALYSLQSNILLEQDFIKKLNLELKDIKNIMKNINLFN